MSPGEDTDLPSLALRQAYHKPEDDVATDFYLPCLARSVAYDRAVGYFSSSIYAIAWPSLRRFVASAGRMRLICSPVLNSDDADALEEGYSARAEEHQGEQIREAFRRLLATPGTVKPARVLASLVGLGVIDFRIAWVGTVAGGRPKRLFHDKLGLFRDDRGNVVAFKGSMNETWPGLALDGNLESVDVFVSWGGDRERDRVVAEQDYFDRLWEGTFPGVITKPLPEVARSDIIDTGSVDDWESAVAAICVEIEAAEGWAPAQGGRTPRLHQVAALDAWVLRGRRGILAHATGSGKTFTALCAIGDALQRGEVPIVLVPSELLLGQWVDELRATFGSGLQLLVCGGGHVQWRQGLLPMWTRPRPTGSPARLVLSMLQTASSPEFLGQVRGGEHLFLVADEVHRLGATQASNVLGLNSGPRMGLSATPERAGDPDGTARVFAYFEGIVPPPFTIFDAITAGTLTPYAYHVSVVSLDADEQDSWNVLSVQIRKLQAQVGDDRSAEGPSQNRLKQLLIKRARVVKAARRKVAAAVEIVCAAYRPGQHWIVYCDDQHQLGLVRDALTSAGCPDVLEYHSAMPGDRHATLALFDAHGGVVVSIRCLDEGVDIPAVSHALILASSKNPREFVQRRGRVLRLAHGKAVAHVYDVLVTPQAGAAMPSGNSIMEGELARAIEFGGHAMNPGCVADLEVLAIQQGLDCRALLALGDEGDNDDEDTGEAIP